MMVSRKVLRYALIGALLAVATLFMGIAGIAIALFFVLAAILALFLRAFGAIKKGNALAWISWSFVAVRIFLLYLALR